MVVKIAIVGAGNVGATVARLLAGAGHEILLSNSHGPDSLRDTVTQLGPGVTAATVTDAVAGADVVLLAVPWGSVTQAVQTTGPLAGVVVIDATNPYGPGGPPGAKGDTASERVRRLIPQARVVKTFNAMAAGRLNRAGGAGEAGGATRLAMPLAGDDTEAKQVVARLVADAGFDPVDTGGLREGGRLQEPGQLLYNTSGTAAELRERLAAGAGRKRGFLTRLRTILAGFRDRKAS